MEEDAKQARKLKQCRELDAFLVASHSYSWQQPNDLGDLRPDIDKLLEQKDGVNLNG